MTTKRLIYTVIIFLTSSVFLFAQDYSKYKPYPNDGFPQIIQASDYRTIEFIETLYSSLSKLNKDSTNCTLINDVVSFQPAKSSNKSASLFLEKDSVVMLKKTKFPDKPIYVLCKTLINVLSDISKNQSIETVKYTQFQTRAYKKRTIIEFKINNKVVLLESDSNGPKDEERLYVLDIVNINDSFFWGM